MTAAGGSLEDCHTNTFVFTDLNGLKWKCLKRNTNSATGAGSLEDDPVLRAYGGCLSRNVLCTWRRCPRGTGDAAFDNPAPRIESPKELWVFWYSVEEPAYVAELQEKELTVDPDYESCEVGVNYETRVLFFKALHHVIERILLRDGFVRFGKFFVRPLEMPSIDAERTLSEYVNAVKFEFSLLGESLVTITVCVQRQPTVLRLSSCHLDAGVRQPVLLGPWTMRGILLPDQLIYGNKTLVKTSAENGKVEATYAKIQAAITHEWKKWKKVLALPVDEDEEEDDDDDPVEDRSFSGGVPQMVLVEIDGVPMFYPSCFIGVLAHEIDFAHLKRRAARSANSNAASHSGEALCAEDHEVEEILSTPSTAKLPPRIIVAPPALSHCRRSYDGIRAARCSFEDGCLSVLLGRRSDSTETRGLLSGFSSFLSGSASVGMADDARWNFFDYLRREYCYCKMCTNSNPGVMDADNVGLSQLMSDSNHAFHRSPLGNVEAVTPDHSPTFVDELKALRLATTFNHDKDSCGASTASSSSSTTTEIRSCWVFGVSSRPGEVGGRLEMDRGHNIEADVFELLSNNRNFPADDRSASSSNLNLPPPRIISPFTPIGAISPQSQDDVSDSEMDTYSFSTKKTDPVLQQRLRDFDYTFNPLKSDNFTQRSYHLVEKNIRKSKPLGPPSSNTYLTRSSLVSSNAKSSSAMICAAKVGSGSSKTTKPTTQISESTTSVLKSLLDAGTPDSRPPSPQTERRTDPSWVSRVQFIHFESGRLPVQEPRSHRQRLKRRKIEVINDMNDELLGDSSIDRNIEDTDLMTSAVIAEDQAELLTADDELKVVNHNETLAKNELDASFHRMNGDSAMLDQMVETPPALLNQPENYSSSSAMDVSESDGCNQGIADHEVMDTSNSHSTTDRQNLASDSKGCHEISHYSFSSGSNHMVGSSDQLLSPPASNERIEFTGMSSSVFSTLGNNQSTSLYGPQSAGAVVTDSLSIIYPTPPTPMQQFSPQNVVVNVNQLSTSSTAVAPITSAISPSDSIAHHPPLKHTLTEPALLPKKGDNAEAVESYKENLFNFNDNLNNVRPIFPRYHWSKKAKGTRLELRYRVESRNVPNYRSKGTCLSTRNGMLPMTSVIRSNNEMLITMDRQLAASLETVEQKLNTFPGGSGGLGSVQPQLHSGPIMMGMVGPRHPGFPNFMAQQPMNNGNFSSEIKAMMARSGGAMPNLQMQHHFMQQQMINNQMQASGMMQTNLMNGPSFRNQHQMMAARQINGAAGNLPFPNQQQTAMMNRFGSPQIANSSNGPPLNRSNSMVAMEENCYVQFSSPKQFGSAQTPQRASSNSSAQNISGISNGILDHAMTSVSSTASSSLSTVAAFSANTTSSTTKISRVSNSPMSEDQLFSKTSLETIMRTLERRNSLAIATLLRDTVLDLHFDSVFDGCPICCCNVNIRTFEMGLYIAASEDVLRCDEILAKKHQNFNFMSNFWSGFQMSDSGNTKCNCGFSAVRHRYLCGGFAGLFSNDSIEACGVRPPGRPAGNALKTGMGRLLWFNTNQQSDREFIDLLRQLSLGRDFCTVARNSFYDKSVKSQKVSLDATHLSDYIVSRLDSIEMDKIMNAVIEAAITDDAPNRIQRPSKLYKQPIHHTWGVQVANEVREPKDSEYIATIREVQPLLEEAMRSSRNGVPSQVIKKFEGPLTWRSFILKTSKVHTQQQEDEICQVEPIPNVIVATEREPITTSPQFVSMWEKLSLCPYDQTKDVLYLAVVPDSNIVVEKCRIFMEELSSVYSECRFGHHGRINVKDGPRDGIIRLNCSSMTNNTSNVSANTNLLPAFEEQFLSDQKAAMARLKGYTDSFETEMFRFFMSHEGIFSKHGFYETLHRNKQKQSPTSLANSDSDRMPPPPVPMQSPNSILSSVSGPSSANAAALMQAGQSISPNTQHQRQQQQPQISPTAGPSSAPSTSNIGPSLEELTPDSGLQQQFLQQTQQEEEERFEKEVQELMAAGDNPKQLVHMIVIYLVNPFSFGSDAQHPIFARVAMVALMRAYNSFLRQLNVNFRPQLQLEIVSLQSLYDYAAFCTDPLHEDRQNIDLVGHSNREKMSARDCLRKIAFTVFSQPRSLVPEHVRDVMTKSMTRFGSASSFGDILDSLKTRPFPRFFKIQSCPFILSPTKSIGVFTNKDGSVINPTSNAIANSKLQLVSNEERILFVSYCLIGDEWLCAAVTDEQGHLLDNVLINLMAQVPPNSSNGVAWQYANQSQIFDSIQRLWLYIQSILVMEIRNWRLVIGRIGKLGHGEFKAWTEMLSKKNLRAYNSSLKGGKPNSCKPCSQMSGYQEMPAIFSACLISTEPELHLRVFPSSVQSENNPNSNLFTASVSFSGGSAGNSSSSGTSLSKNSKSKSTLLGPSMSAVNIYDPSVTHIMVFPTILNISFEPQTQQNDDDDFENFFTSGEKMEDEELRDFMNMDTIFADTKNDEVTNIDNQPMATGYYISTAPALDMPEWFWSSCPSARRRSPVHLKNSLHIHTGNIQQSDEIATLGGKSGGMEAHHPLDSSATDEVLKYVLEKYNALSWMNVDFATGARLSCLPVHVQALLRLYKNVTMFFS